MEKKTIALRVTEEEQQRIRDAAMYNGHDSMTTWILQLIRKELKKGGQDGDKERDVCAVEHH